MRREIYTHWQECFQKYLCWKLQYQDLQCRSRCCSASRGIKLFLMPLSGADGCPHGCSCGYKLWAFSSALICLFHCSQSLCKPFTFHLHLHLNGLMYYYLVTLLLFIDHIHFDWLLKIQNQNAFPLEMYRKKCAAKVHSSHFMLLWLDVILWAIRLGSWQGAWIQNAFTAGHCSDLSCIAVTCFFQHCKKYPAQQGICYGVITYLWTGETGCHRG